MKKVINQLNNFSKDLKKAGESLDEVNENLEEVKESLDKNADKISSYVSIGILGIYIYLCGKEIYNEVKKLMED